MSTPIDNRRIAKNTLLLYARTFVALLLSLYISRLLLKTLGVEDLGIYNLVGGIVTLLSFFSNAQRGATSRFITYQLGLDNSLKEVKHVFCVTLSIHIILGLIILVLGESIGQYVLLHWTEIPIERQSAANLVFHCSLLLFTINVLRVPYESAVIAHEDMSAFAYISIVEVVLKLGVVLLIQNSLGDKLIAYGFLLFVASLLTFLLYSLYIYKKYSFYKGRPQWDGTLIKTMLTFSGWSLLGASSNMVTQQGVSLLFNNFVGLVANAAMGFTNQVNAAVGQFVNSFTTAFNPQVVKLCAKRDYQQLHLLMCRSSKFSFLLAYVMALPLIINMDLILHLWLDNVPQYTTSFCQLILICTVIDATTGVYNTTITATGKIRNYQCCIAASFFLDFCCAYLLLVCELNPAIVFGSRILTRGILNMIFGLHFIRTLIDFNVKSYLSTVIFPILVIVAVTVPCNVYMHKMLTGFNSLIVTTITSTIVTMLAAWLMLLNRNEKAFFINHLSALSRKIGIAKR